MIEDDSLIHGNYEYAGFYYEIHELYSKLYAIPRKGQHEACKKEKHRKAAVECFDEEYKWSTRK